MDAKTRLRLRDDVAILSVDEIDGIQRAELDCRPDDFVISQLRGRSSSILIDKPTAELLQGFDPPCTFARAVVQFCASRDLEPEGVLEASFPLVARLAHRGFLVDADATNTPSPNDRVFHVGDSFGVWTIVRFVQGLDGSELYQVTDREQWAALKLHRSAEGSQAESVGSLAHEARILVHLDGRLAPRILASGEEEDFRYLILEWCRGLDAQEAAQEWRRRPGSRSRQLQLCQHIAAAYAQLHQLGVLHGDVHPRNVVIDADGRVRIIDFGVARFLGEEAPPAVDRRPGLPFYFEPELARSLLSEKRPIPVSELGEQYAVGVLLYYLVTGVHYCDFGLEARDLYRHISEAAPVAFAARGLRPWPGLEAILHRALAKEPAERCASMTELAGALSAVDSGRAATETSVRRRLRPLSRLREQVTAAAGLDGLWLEEGLESKASPTASVHRGAAGVALALLRLACQRDDPGLLALADVWCRQAEQEIGRPQGFYNAALNLGEEQLGRVTPFHGPSGLYAVAAMIAHARGDRGGFASSIEAFVTASQPDGEEAADLTTGRGGTLLLSALLVDLHARDGAVDPLLDLGDSCCQRLWDPPGVEPPMAEPFGDSLGMAHGWAGLLYATLQWSRASGRSLPAAFERRLDELAGLSIPRGQGLVWGRPGVDVDFPAGWCQGSAGQVFLWCLASRYVDRDRFGSLAIAAGEAAWQAGHQSSTLCCGLVGRAYAMLRLFQDSSHQLWLERARDLALGAIEHRPESIAELYEGGLFQGWISLAVLAADLERPEDAVFPFFQEEPHPSDHD